MRKEIKEIPESDKSRFPVSTKGIMANAARGGRDRRRWRSISMHINILVGGGCEGISEQNL